MALINRVSRLFKADFHAVLDHLEEPELLLKQAIRDMEDELAAAERRIDLCRADQDAISHRQTEIANALLEIREQLDLCFESGKDELAKKLVRKKLEAEQLQKRLNARYAANENFLGGQQRQLDSHRTTLEGLRQKAEIVAHRPVAGSTSDIGDRIWIDRDARVDDDEVEVAFLREKNARSGS